MSRNDLKENNFLSLDLDILYDFLIQSSLFQHVYLTVTPFKGIFYLTQFQFRCITGQILAYFKILVVSEYLTEMKIECLDQITRIF